MTFDELLKVGAAGLAVGGSFWVLFAKIDEHLSSEAKQRFTEYLLKINLGELTPTWPETARLLIDKLFGERPFSVRFILTSIAATILASVLMILIWYTLRPDQFVKYAHNNWDTWYGQIWRLIAISLVYWSIPDYVALLKTRHIIKLIANTSSVSKRIILIVIDAVMPFLIYPVCIALLALWFACFWLVGSFVITMSGGKLASPIGVQIANNLEGLYYTIYWIMSTGAQFTVADPNTPGLISPGIFFYSMFLPSIWLWLYVIAGAVVAFVVRLRSGARFVRWALDVEKKPLSSIGLVAGCIAAIVTWIVVLVLTFIGAISSKHERSTGNLHNIPHLIVRRELIWMPSTWESNANYEYQPLAAQRSYRPHGLMIATPHRAKPPKSRVTTVAASVRAMATIMTSSAASKWPTWARMRRRSA